MASCSRCSASVSEHSSFCAACGHPIGASSETPTVFTDHPTTPSARGISHAVPGAGGFTPGQIVAERYRIVGLLGRGGMGEVYRADDLKLGMAVALKFLPREVERIPAVLERFHAEVRTARQVSHPHVCRVYDIGDVDGHHFLTMEYVDGEDLATLLRRIGRLPPAKAVEIARQLCAGLAAAHDKGVIHRDLKPANVMIDGHGRARITDFGLAVLGEDAAAETAGTPAYMSPEQLAGMPASVQSDVYALGLVMYEIFTGKPAFTASSLAEWRRVHNESRPASPSLHIADVDPMVERVILRCLEKEPSQRPRSAVLVATALPGGDPLAAAIAAGETPSPEMVAAAGGEGSLAPSRAWGVLAAFLVLFATVAALSPYSLDLGLAPMAKSPEVLRDRAREIVGRLGSNASPADEATWLERDYPLLRWLADHLPSVAWRRRLREIGSPVLFHYLRADVPMISDNPQGVLRPDDPVANSPGSVHVVVDATGRLREARVTPPRWVSAAARAAPNFPEAVLFEAAGLDPDRFESVTPEWLPAVPFDARREWTGSRAELPELPLRLSAAVLDGRVVWMSVLGPWSRDTVTPADRSLTAAIARATLATFILIILVSGAIFARRNLRLGRGDRHGAARVAVALFVLELVGWFAGAHLSLSLSNLLSHQVFPALSSATLAGAAGWVIYVALEPYVRRRMPDLLVGWARVLDGRFRDPRVGRDVLFGLAMGTALAATYHLVNALPTWFSFSSQTTVPLFRAGFEIDPGAAALAVPADAIARSLSGLALLFVVRSFVSRTWLSGIVIGIVFSLIALGGENPMLETPAAMIQGALLAYATARLGLLSLLTTWFTHLALITFPIGAGYSSWYAPFTYGTVALLLALAAWAFVTSLGGRPAFGSMTLDD